MRQNCSYTSPSSARYYNSDLSIWLSVDPMSDKYPGVSPYVYCENNPVRLVDPDGSEIGDIYNLNGQHIGKDDKNDGIVYLYETTDDTQLTTEQSKTLIRNGTVINITEQTGLTNDELNLRASLSTLKRAEAGRSNQALDYNAWNNHKFFTEKTYDESPDDYKNHPGKNPSSKSSAAGAYQFLERFYLQDDFSPQSQDKAAVKLMTTRGYTAALSGDMEKFIIENKSRWTSLEHWKSYELQHVFNQYRANELTGKSDIATPIGGLLRK